MLVLTSWLREFIDFEVPVEKLAEDLTMSGLEVEGIEPAMPWLKTVVAARVKQVKPHPGRSDLKICEIEAGGHSYQVVCGAPNVKEGIVAPLALPGTELPELGEVKQAQIHGINSYGVLCSEAELLIGEDASGLMLLEKVAEDQLGTPLSRLLPVDDWVLEIGVTPNRADCLSVLGIAREVGAIYEIPLREPGLLSGLCPEGAQAIPVIIEDQDLCGRYAGAVIEGVDVKPSPVWIKKRLIASGVRPINNIVDITNLVLMERGQPLHAFDLDTLKGPQIRVRRAREGERILTLDGKLRELSNEMLVIADRDRPIAVAGVMGGAETEVTENTRRILLESAWFTPSQIRRTSKTLKLPTEASYRFERGVDPEGVMKALTRAAQLITKICKGASCKGVCDEYPVKLPQKKITLRFDRVNMLLGTKLSEDYIKGILTGIGLEIRNQEAPGKVQCLCPSYRMDLIEETDLVEEVARLYGFSKIPTEAPRASIDAEPIDPFERLFRRTKQLLFAQGLSEVISYSFISQKEIEALCLAEGDRRKMVVRLQNPLSEEQAIMRTSLIPCLLTTTARNQARRHLDLHLFEIGMVFYATGSETLPEEEQRVCCLITGHRHPESWTWPQEKTDFYDLKGVLEELLKGLGIKDFGVELGTPEDPYYLVGTSARIFIDKDLLGTIGQIDPKVLDLFEIKGDVFVFDLSFEVLLKHATDQRIFKPLPRYPSVERDAAIILSQDVPAALLLTLVKEQQIPILEDVKIFDVYTGKPIPRGYKSIGLRFKYRASDHTLSESEVASIHKPLINLILERFNARLRDS